jgi:hypothetical protein
MMPIDAGPRPRQARTDAVGVPKQQRDQAGALLRTLAVAP